MISYTSDIPEPTDYGNLNDEWKRVIEGWFVIYKQDPQLYISFAHSLDSNGSLKQFIRKIVDSRGKKILDVGAGPGVLTKRYFGDSKFVHCVEPSSVFRTELDKLIWKGECTIHDQPPLSPLCGTMDVCFASWPHCDVSELDKYFQKMIAAKGTSIIVMNNGNDEFAELWPVGASATWQARITQLLRLGYQYEVIHDTVLFASAKQAGQFISRVFDKQLNKPQISHDIAVLWKQNGNQ